MNKPRTIRHGGFARCVAAMFLLACAWPAPASAQSRAAAQDRLTPAQMQADFDALRRALEEAHGGLYRFASKTEIDRRFDAYRARLAQPMTTRAFIGTLAELLAGIRDGHTMLAYDAATTAALTNARLFPLRLLIEDGGFTVLLNEGADTAIRPGMDIVSINGRTPAQLQAVMLPKMPRDGFIESGARSMLMATFAQSYWLFVEPAEEFHIVARDAGGRTIPATLAGVRTADRQADTNPVNAQILANVRRLRGPADNISLGFIDDPAIAHVRVRSFAGGTFYSTIDSVFRTLRERGTRALILDLRGNGGGQDMYGARLVAQFTDAPFRYFDHIKVRTTSPSFADGAAADRNAVPSGYVRDPDGGFRVTAARHPGVGEQRPGAHPFLGTVIVLTDGGTFSTASDVAAVLHHVRRPTYVGEETGGGYEGNTSGMSVPLTLSNSGLRLRVQMWDYYNAVPRNNGRGTIPDEQVVRRVADLLRGVDAPLERAIELARARAN